MAKRIVQDIKPNPKRKSKPAKEEASSVVLGFSVDNNDNYEIKEKTRTVEKERSLSFSAKSNKKESNDSKDTSEEIENDSIQDTIYRKPRAGQKYDHLLRPIQDEDDLNIDDSEYFDDESTNSKPNEKSMLSKLNPFSWFSKKQKDADEDDLGGDEVDDLDETSIREISDPKISKNRQKEIYSNLDDDEEYEDMQEDENPHADRHTKKYKKHFPIIFAVLGILVLLYAVLTIFERVIVTIKPKKFDYTALDLPITLKSEPSDSNLPLKIIEFTSDDKIEVEGGEVSEIAIKSQGQITLYNNYSKSSQYLLQDTRLFSTNGLIYKIKGETVIPGFTTDSKGVKTPGQVTVTAIAEFPGVEYNQGLTDFSILGFKGTPKEKAFYGRSATEMKGGYKGTGANISESQKSEKSDELRKQIEGKLLTQAKSNIPEGSVLLDSGYRIEFGEVSQDFSTSDKKVLLSLTGKFYGIILNQKELESKILNSKNLDEKSRTGLIAKNLDTITMTIENPKDFDSGDNDVLVKIKGDISFNSVIDENAIRTSLANRKIADFKSILQNEYNNIESASLSLRPPWIRTFPEKISGIKIKIND